MDTAALDSTPQWQRDPLPAVASALRCSLSGLTQSEAAARLRVHGLNIVSRQKRLPIALQFIARLRNPLILLLIGSSIVLAWTGDVTSTAIIVLMVIASATLDFVQEHRAERAIEKLQATIAATAEVLRDGARHTIAAARLVPGDVVILRAGDVVPADGRLVEASGLFVNESALTGESYPVEKRVGAPPAAGADDVVRMGTAVAGGTATFMVCATGNTTALGSLAAMLAEPVAEHPLERGTRQFGMMILRLTLFLVLFVVLVNASFHRPVLESFLFAVALAVGLTPELLPMIVSVTLAHGALRLASRHVIVKRPAAIYALGSMDVLCTDKTGTLTQARISLAASIDADGAPSAAALELACMNSRYVSGARSPLDDALLAAAPPTSHEMRKIDELPFDFERRRVAVLVAGLDGERTLIVKGAPEEVLHECTQFDDSGRGPRPLDDVARARIVSRFETLGEQGYRVLAVAQRTLPAAQQRVSAQDEAELTFVGFVTFLDPPLHDAAGALAGLARAGITVKIVTGDNERVARHVCAALDLAVAHALGGREIDAMDDEQLASAALDTTLFCRVSPAQKTRILRALRSRGRVVGFMGDGINDAPALHAADLGISVQGAVGVAREAADIILTRRHLSVLREGVLEGRRTYGNIMKYLMMATSSNFGNMLSMAAATLFLPFLPLLPVQILLNNLLYDVSEVPIPLDRVDEAELRRPRVWDMHYIRRFMLTMGPISSLFDFLTFAVLLLVVNAGPELFRTGWFIESIATQVLVIFVIRTRHSALHSRPHPLLIATSLGVVAIALALPYTPIGPLLGFVAPPLSFMLILIALIATYLVLAEYAKRWFYRTQQTPPRPRRRGILNVSDRTLP